MAAGELGSSFVRGLGNCWGWIEGGWGRIAERAFGNLPSIDLLRVGCKSKKYA